MGCRLVVWMNLCLFSEFLSLVSLAAGCPTAIFIVKDMSTLLAYFNILSIFFSHGLGT